jgi:hypothetical protein
MHIVALLIAVSAIAVGGWIGYRATRTDRACFSVNNVSGTIGIECMNPDDTHSYRVVYVQNRRVHTLP